MCLVISRRVAGCGVGLERASRAAVGLGLKERPESSGSGLRLMKALGPYVGPGPAAAKECHCAGRPKGQRWGGGHVGGG